jgi:MFS family permease
MDDPSTTGRCWVTSALPTRHHRLGWLLASLLGGRFLGNVDIAVVNVATPSISSSLHASGGELELIVSGYTLAYALLLITSSRLGDMRGYRRMYLLGLAGFTLASLACGLAPNAVALVLTRIVQGGAAALMISQVLTSIQLHFDGAARGRALGLYSAVLAGSAVIGQALGGVLVSANLFGTAWRPIFLVNVPLGALLLGVAGRFLPVDADRGPATRRLDLLGVGTLSAALSLLLVPLILGRDLGWPAWTWWCLLTSAPAFALFVAAERQVTAAGGYPLINLELLGRRAISWGLAGQVASTSTYFALLFVLALYLQRGLGRSALYSGLALVSWVAAFGVAGPVLGRLPERAKGQAARVGPLVLAAAFAGIGVSLLAGNTSGVLLMSLLGVGGLGFGAAFSGVLAHLTGAVSSRHAPDMSGLFNTTIRLGGVIGVAVFGSAYLAMAPQPGPQAAIHGFAVIAFAFAATALAGAVAAYLSTRPVRGRGTGEAIGEAAAAAPRRQADALASVGTGVRPGSGQARPRQG